MAMRICHMNKNMNKKTGNSTMALLFSVTITTKNEYAAFMLKTKATRQTSRVMMYESLSVSRLISAARIMGSAE